MTKNKFVFVVSIVFLIIGIIHIIRLISGWDVQVGGLEIPKWVSYAGALVAFYLSFTGFRQAKNN